MIAGGSEGIGFNIANAYAAANAARIVIVSRTQSKIEKAVDSLRHRLPKVFVEGHACDVSTEEDIKLLWGQLADQAVFVDTLVLNAAAMLDTKDLAATIKMFHFNITANLHMLEHFQNQVNPDNRQKILIHVSSASLQAYNNPKAAYAGSKAGFTNYLCHIADFVPEETLRIINFHPGSVYTSAAETYGASIDLPIWDDPSLAGHMALWLASKEAAFLHGRFVWANWDADELMEMKDRVAADVGFMKVGITGVNSFTVQDLMKCTEVPAPKQE